MKQAIARPVLTNGQMLWNAAATLALSWFALSLFGLVH